MEDFVNDLAQYDCVYFGGVDDIFIEKYSDAFNDPTLLVEGSIYRIVKDRSKVKLL